jgi:hypothetical protein
MDDAQFLHELNMQISEAENQGNKAWLAQILAPRLAFQRADPARTVDDGVAFLQKVHDGGKRKTVSVEPIKIYGDRAIVECIVQDGEARFHNLRLFVRREGSWKLLGWANERV